MQSQEMSLNIWYHLPQDIWDKVPDMYQSLEGWLGFGDGFSNGEKGIPYWFSYNKNEKHVIASVEPGGLQFSGLMDSDEWELWVKNIKVIATKHLGFKVGEIELGEVDYDIEYL